MRLNQKILIGASASLMISVLACSTKKEDRVGSPPAQSSIRYCNQDELVIDGNGQYIPRPGIECVYGNNTGAPIDSGNYSPVPSSPQQPYPNLPNGGAGYPNPYPSTGAQPPSNYPYQPTPGQYYPGNQGQPFPGYPGTPNYDQCALYGINCYQGGQPYTQSPSGIPLSMTVFGVTIKQSTIDKCMQKFAAKGVEIDGAWPVWAQGIQNYSVANQTVIVDQSYGPALVVIQGANYIASMQYILMNPDALYCMDVDDWFTYSDTISCWSNNVVWARDGDSTAHTHLIGPGCGSGGYQQY